jgi:hypothetical protein
MKLSKLTPEQEALIPKVKDFWINNFLNHEEDLKLDDIKDEIYWVYEKIGLKKPIILIADNWYNQQLMYNFVKIYFSKTQLNQVENQVENQVGDQVRNQVENQVRNQVWNQVENQVWNQVGDQVRNQVENQVWNQVENQVENQVGNQVENQVGNQVGDQVENQVRNQVWNQVGDQIENQVRNQVRNQVGDQVENQVGNQVWNQVRNQVENQVRNQVGDQVRNQVENQVRNQVRNQVGDQVWNQVRNQVWNQVENQVWDQVRNQVRNQKLEFIWNYYGSGFYNSWFLSFYDFFEKVGIVKNADFIKWKKLTSNQCNILWFENFVFVSKLPIKTKLDNNGRLHSITGPAIEWRGYYSNYFIHGVGFDKELWKKVSQRKLTIKQILKLENIEQRYISLQLYGAEKLLEECKAKLIDKSTRGNYLYEISTLIPNRKVKLLKYTCPSTERIYVSFVPDEIMKADKGMAWKFQINEDEYSLLRIEA